ncbi:MAG: restriction endonuclease subunit S [Myxococcales bacterium]|nr:restriction endonuclease subunit S [Myxococcales bacterium]
MNLDTFFEKFDLFADAPNAVAKMRELILWLAVRGKLTKQNLGEESGQELLARIWRNLAQQKSITKPSSFAIDTTESLPSLPMSWVWARFCEVAIIASNLVDPSDYLDSIHLAPDNIEKGTGKLLPCRTIREDEVKSSKHRFYSGQVVYSKIRPNLAKVVVVNFDGLCSADMYPIDSLIDAKFLQIFMLSDIFLAQAVKSDTRVAMPKINQTELNAICVSIPPLAEQKRIVAKVDELMALCDRLEAQQQQRETRHTALAQASLTRFADAPTTANLELLFHKAFSVVPSQLRKTIIDLAVQGRLISQNTDDGTAAAFVHQLQIQRRDSYEGGRIAAEKAHTRPPKRPSNDFNAYVSEQIEGMPTGWCETRIGDIAECLDYLRVPVNKAERLGDRGEIPYYGANGQVGWIDKYLFNEPLVLVVEDETFIGRVKPFSYMIYGKSWVNNHAHVLRPLTGMSAEYLNLCLCQYPFIPLTSGTTGRRKLTQASLLDAKLWVAPPPEQKRIVAKVEQLMGLVDRLEAQLAESRAKATALLDAVVAELSAAA